MKRLAKLTAVFAVICMALAFGACSHSSSSSSDNDNTPDVTAYAGTWGVDGIDWDSEDKAWYEYIVIEKDGTYTYYKLDVDSKATSGSHKGDVTDVKDSKLTLTPKYWYSESGTWTPATSDDKIYMEVLGDNTAIIFAYWESGLLNYVYTFTKKYTPVLKDYYGTWGCSYNGDDWYDYFVIEEKDNICYRYNINCSIDKLTNDNLSDNILEGGINKGTWKYDESSNTMKLPEEYWYNAWDENETWSDDGMENGKEWGFNMKTISTTSAEVIETMWDAEIGYRTYKKISNSTSLFKLE